MKNFSRNGGVITLQAPRALASGEAFVVGSIFAIAASAAASGALVEAATHGVHTLPKTSGQAWSSGTRVYWDNANRRCDTSSAAGPLVGAAATAAAPGAAAGDICLSGSVLGVANDAPAGSGNFISQRAANGNAIFA